MNAEIIDMNDQELIQQALLDTMDEFHQFCEVGGLEYFLIGGALIGAVRHGGFIPWDDDIDVVMPRSDFDKLLTMSSEFESPFKLRHRTIEMNYGIPIAKLENMTVEIREGYYSGNTGGVFIDIFPLDCTFERQWLQSLHFKIVSIFRVLMILKYGTFSRRKYPKLTLRILSWSQLLMRLFPSAFLERMLRLSESLAERLGARVNVANLHGRWKKLEVASRELFRQRKLLDFENRKFWSIANYDIWLSQVYGDYMKLPPERERAPDHIEEVIGTKK